MFSRDRGDVVLPTWTSTPAETALPARGGAIGVGTWATQAEYKDIRVTQGDKVLFECDFADGLKGWQTIGGQWKVKDGALAADRQRDRRPGHRRRQVLDRLHLNTLKARKLGGAEGFLILFNVQDETPRRGGTSAAGATSATPSKPPDVGGQGVPGRIETGRWYDIRIETAGGRIRCYLDGKLIHDAGGD